LALVLTLFVVALVTVLVLEYHFDASVELDLAANYASDVQAYHLAMAGVRFAQALLQQDDPKTDGPDDLWYKLGLVPVCFAPQQLLALAAAGAGEGLAAGGSDTKGAAFVRTTSVSSASRGIDRAVASTVSASRRPSIRVGGPSASASRPLTVAPATLPSRPSRLSLSPSSARRGKRAARRSKAMQASSRASDAPRQ